MIPIQDGRAAMAGDLGMLDAAELGRSSVRAYRWNGPWVSLGRFQRPEEAVADRWERWVLRPTGGRAVLHGHDLTVAMAFGVEAGASREVRTIYRRTANLLIDAFLACGILARLGEPAGAGRRNPAHDCFAFASANDLVDAGGRKLCGCAFRVTRRACLLQASIPTAPPLVPPHSAIRDAGESGWVRLDDEVFVGNLGLAFMSQGR